MTITPEIASAAAPALHRTARHEPRRRRRLLFWVCRYLPAEIAGTAALVVAGLGVTVWTDSPPIVALAALVGESLGFYLVLALTVYGEQWAHLQRGTRARRRALLRTGGLLLAEFGPSELLDSLLVRPAALVVGVWLLGPLWGVIAGKLVADVVFYAIAASAFTLTERTGLRRATAGPAAEAVQP